MVICETEVYGLRRTFLLFDFLILGLLCPACYFFFLDNESEELSAELKTSK
ncbi:hypothetical protein BDN70DRAFT_320207 [Pholiota conissans]|uniref:Uncharacterized protein n=1 Tax=Pholiota conissans TaxID=109636 RepID=A0A9P6CP96_9AGAR|nr:hypothetical protein BDN70DRAFT_320207 [Pholiota conissans]